jgi:hypothetical protein
MTTTKAVAHRVRQARTAALRAQLALTLTQLLLWVSLIGVVIAAALWAKRRIMPGEQTAPVSPPSETVTSDTSPSGLS